MEEPPFTKKSLGQHWLHDNAILADIAASANITPQDTVLEIGPGLGTLTAVLTKSAKQVVAVEYDEKLAHELPGRVPQKNLEVVTQDILTFDFSQLPADYKIVANIPYYLTSNLIRTISETPNAPAIAVLLIQKEVAERVAAEPGAMSILSVTAQFYWQVSLGNIVAARFFSPPPKVDSQILILTKRKIPLFPDIDSKSYFHVVKAGFSQRRKTLLNSLSAGLRLDRTMIKRVCQSAGVEDGRRAQTLTLDEWHELYVALQAENSDQQ